MKNLKAVLVFTYKQIPDRILLVPDDITNAALFDLIDYDETFVFLPVVEYELVQHPVYMPKGN